MLARWKLTSENNRVEAELVETGPVKEVILVDRDIDLTAHPIVTHNEKDAGPCITARAKVVKDPETGTRNAGIYRHMVHNEKQIGIHLAETSHSNFVYVKCINIGKPMEVAITVSMHPAFYLGVLSFVPFGIDEYSVVAGLNWILMPTLGGEGTK